MECLKLLSYRDQTKQGEPDNKPFKDKACSQTEPRGGTRVNFAEDNILPEFSALECLGFNCYEYYNILP